MEELRKRREPRGRLARFGLLMGVLLAGAADASRPHDPVNGQVHSAGETVEVWDATDAAWVSPEGFWLAYAQGSSGRFWGRKAEYPPYSDVEEHDTVLIEVSGGPCLMYFFHNRWRRAQDVRRWDSAFNGIRGCPRVFD
ncbi:MAG: hypothetical protein OES38_20740 [Gammaproteobacteria bacterium]|nr:hypothetical protein [Gammaproteobacteria bacterium]